MVSKSPGRNGSKPTGGLEIQRSEGRAPVFRAKAEWRTPQLTDAMIHFGGVVGTARWQGHAKQLEKPSSSRREIGGAGKPYNREHREVGGRREGGGWVCSSDEAEQCPWSQEALLFVVAPTIREARVI